MVDATDISVAVERAVHDALCDLAKSIYERHGIQVNSAFFEWVDVSTHEQRRALVTSVTVDSKTMAPQGAER